MHTSQIFLRVENNWHIFEYACFVKVDHAQTRWESQALTGS